ncbi:MAG TPA: lytic transglycosylase domain-containing protein [Leptospiraceae bacterium]|nr:lytic transglycosylase domain-containing protein [Leptospiraceae bacterium]HMW05750.1 lytic transglycosylase domain-containing protein [Leptospiraceae bacterium]HMX32483.1 lytic transglycosylase domain-containing protein [Leptospiraceae bacterium]HMY30217.1 lytic transglycosylase domain-containing protein [Leptospiraceae bacterium]HMZ67174.1 lytic transglycosylase domain-containing protein [Leptospiraceae bacterium]
MSWRKINRTLNIENLPNESAAYALVRYYEEHNEKSSVKNRLLYGIITGIYPKEVGRAEINHLLTNPLKDSRVIAKLSYLKLYKEFVKQKQLTESEKIVYLQKYTMENDPVVIKAFEEILKLHLDTKEYDQVLKRIDSLTEEEKKYIFTPEVKYIYAISLYHSGKKEEGKKNLLSLFLDKNSNSSIKHKAMSGLKDFSNELTDYLTREELAAVILTLPIKEQRSIAHRKIFNASQSYNNERLVKNITLFFLNTTTHNVLPFLKTNYNTISKEENFLANVAEDLINKRETRLAYDLQNTYLKNSTNPLVHKNYSRIHKKNKQEEKYFSSLLEYLKLNPYDLRYHDSLIDFLANSDSKSIAYMPDEYWNRAIEAIPNLPVKGRLIYWYLRFLRFKGETDKLKFILSSYYSYCPGSYYTSVIAEEFNSEIKTLPAVDNPTSSKENLFKYLSVNNNSDYVKPLVGHNLNFAYYKDSIDLGQRLSNASSKIQSQKILLMAVEYLKVGEFDRGIYIIDDYANRNNLNENEKFELYVGAGDLSKNAYLSLYYTRQLMKSFKIPDDPLLLPSSITTRLYPRPHLDIVKESAKEFSVDEDIVYAIMRQESFFRENAISPSNARGLMQVMPATGRIIAKKLKIENYSLHDPEVSIKFGTKFIADLLNSYGALKWASIAYNGGPGNLRKWKRNHYMNDFNHFLEELPSKESRDYCRIIISNYINYKVLRKLDGNGA